MQFDLDDIVWTSAFSSEARLWLKLVIFEFDHKTSFVAADCEQLRAKLYSITLRFKLFLLEWAGWRSENHVSISPIIS